MANMYYSTLLVRVKAVPSSEFCPPNSWDGDIVDWGQLPNREHGSLQEVFGIDDTSRAYIKLINLSHQHTDIFTTEDASIYMHPEARSQLFNKAQSLCAQWFERKAWLKNIDENTSHFSDYVEQAEKEGGYLPLAMGSQAEIPTFLVVSNNAGTRGTPNSTDYGLDLSFGPWRKHYNKHQNLDDEQNYIHVYGYPYRVDVIHMTTRWAPPKEAAQQLRKRFPNWDIVCFFHSFDDGKTGAFSVGTNWIEKTLSNPHSIAREIERARDSGRSSASSNSTGTSSNRSPKKPKQPKIRSPRPQVADDKMAPGDQITDAVAKRYMKAILINRDKGMSPAKNAQWHRERRVPITDSQMARILENPTGNTRSISEEELAPGDQITDAVAKRYMKAILINRDKGMSPAKNAQWHRAKGVPITDSQMARILE